MISESTALAKVELPDGPVGSIQEVRTALARISDQCNLVTAIASPDFIPPLHRVSFRVVALDPTVDERGNGGDCYRSGLFCQKNERALTKIGLLRILDAAGGSLVDTHRTDDRSDPHYCEWTVTIAIPMLDGKVRRFAATKEVDLRDGSDQASSMKPAQLAGSRSHIAALAESKAMNRAIRGGLSLKQKYTTGELDKPFVVPALVPHLPMDDPEVRRQVVASMMASQTALYGGGGAAASQPQGPALEPGEVEVLDHEPETVDAEPWEEPQTAADSTDPWDAAPAEAVSCVLPVDVDQIPRDDETRFRYVDKLNDYHRKLTEACGEDQAAAIVAKHSPAEGSPLSWSLEDIASLGKALAAALERAS